MDKKQKTTAIIIASAIGAIILIAALIVAFGREEAPSQQVEPSTWPYRYTEENTSEVVTEKNRETTTEEKTEVDTETETPTTKEESKPTTTRESITKPAKSESKLEMATYAQVAAEDVLKQRVVLPSMSDITVDGVEPRYIITMNNARIGSTKNRKIIVKIEFADSDHEQYQLIQLKVDGRNIDI